MNKMYATTSLSPYYLAIIDRYAARHYKMTRANVIRMAVEEWCERYILREESGDV